MEYEHACRDCAYEWVEEHKLAELASARYRLCPLCQGEDTYICVTTSGAISFKGPGWSPTGYSKSAPLEKLAKQLPVKVYNSKDDHDREMRGEAEQNELRRLKRENEIAKKTMGPDAAVGQNEAERRIKKAGQEAAEGPK